MSSKTNGKHKSGGSSKGSTTIKNSGAKTWSNLPRKLKIMIFFNIDLSVENKLNDSGSP